MLTRLLVFRAAWRLLPALALTLLMGGFTNAHSGGLQTAPAKAPSRGKPFRLMALGDSITRGSGSGYGNYRRPLQSLLVRGGYLPKCVGTSTEQSLNYHGSDPEQSFLPYQPNHEGYGGFRIDQIAGDKEEKDDGGVLYAGLTRTMAAGVPDVVLLMVGTNDINQGFDPVGSGHVVGSGFAADAAARLDRLINRLYHSNSRLTLVLATITPLADPTKETRVKAYNREVARIAETRREKGQDVRLADMHAAIMLSDISADGVHPGTRGYDVMARVWYHALTGQSGPPISFDVANAKEHARLDAPNIFERRVTVAVSNTFRPDGSSAAAAFNAMNLVDSGNRAFVFAAANDERISISGFRSAIGRLRFFDTPSYTGRTPGHVTVYYSAAKTNSLKSADYKCLGMFPLRVVGDTFERRTVPAAHPAVGEVAIHPQAIIGFCDLDHLKVPSGTQSLMLDFSKSGGDGDGLTEIQAFRL